MSTLRRKLPDGRSVAVSDDIINLVATHSYDLGVWDREASVVLLVLLAHTRKLRREMHEEQAK